MSTLSSHSDLDYLQVGKGRLGGLIAEHVQQALAPAFAEKPDNHFARIDAQAGLTDSDGSPLSGVIDRLVICISPERRKSWQWDQLLLGMIEQKARGELKINQLVFISSTGIYDGISQGMISVDTLPKAQSERSRCLLVAENHIKLLADNYHILRCSGLYGAGYQKYSTMLSMTELSATVLSSTVHSTTTLSPTEASKAITSQEIAELGDAQPRFGVNIESVAKTVVERLKQERSFNSLSVLTDGYCYLSGHKIPIDEARQLGLKCRLLLPGVAKI